MAGDGCRCLAARARDRRGRRCASRESGRSRCWLSRAGARDGCVLRWRKFLRQWSWPCPDRPDEQTRGLADARADRRSAFAGRIRDVFGGGQTPDTVSDGGDASTSRGSRISERGDGADSPTSAGTRSRSRSRVPNVRLSGARTECPRTNVGKGRLSGARADVEGGEGRRRGGRHGRANEEPARVASRSIGEGGGWRQRF